MKTIMIEFKRFIKNKRKIILIGALIVSVLTVALYVAGEVAPSPSDTTEDELGPVGESSNEGSSYFQMYVENTEDGSAFTNNGLLTNYFYSEDIINELDSLVSINLTEIIEQQELERRVTEVPLQRVIEVSFSDVSNIFTIYAHSENTSDNRKIINYYYDLILNNDITVLDGKEVYVLREPSVIELPENSESLARLSQNPEVSGSQVSSGISIVNVVVFLIVGFIIGAILMILLAYTIELFSKKLNYSFTYFVDDGEKFMLGDDELENMAEVKHFIQFPDGNSKLFLVENDPNNLSTEMDNSMQNIVFGHNILEEDNIENYSEIILTIIPEETSRSWLNQQKRMLELYDIPVKILQLNS